MSGFTRLIGRVIPTVIKRHRLTQALRTRFIFHAKVRARLRRQLTGAPRPSARGSAPRVLVPLIETAHYQHFQILLLAKALQMRGAEVKVLICGQALDGCEVKSIRNEGSPDPCWKCRFNERNALPLFDLDVLRLADVVSEPEREAMRQEAARLVEPASAPLVRGGVSLDQSINDSVTRYYYGALPYDQAAIRRVRQAHTTAALLSLEVAQRIDAQWRPDVVLTHMYCYAEWEPFFEHYRRQGNRFRSVSVTPFDYHSLVFSGFELFQSTERFQRYVRSRARPTLEPHERRALEEFVAVRSSGRAKIFRDYGYFEPAADRAALERTLGAEPGKRRIFLFSNVHWDVGMSACAGIFADTLDWVLETIELVRNEPSCHLYIKPHPAEVFDSSTSLKGVAQVVRERYPVLPANVTIIEPQWKVNTYELFGLIDVGVIFNGTLGLEMMLAGIPVVSTGRTTHHGLGLANEPQSLDEYRRLLTGQSAPRRAEREPLELFAYFYFIRTLIPWRLTKQVYGDDFDGFTISDLRDLQPGRDPWLDHLCGCILDPTETVAEAWPSCVPAIA